MRDPGAFAGPQNRLERGDHPARGHHDFDAVPAPDVHVRLAIRDDEQRPLQVPAHVRAQPLGRPVRLGHVAQPRFFLRGGARRHETLRQPHGLFGDWAEQTAPPGGAAYLAGTQVAHPVGRLRNRTEHRRLNDANRDERPQALCDNA